MNKRYGRFIVYLACGCVLRGGVTFAAKPERWCYVHGGVFVVARVEDTQAKSLPQTTCATLFDQAE